MAAAGEDERATATGQETGRAAGSAGGQAATSIVAYGTYIPYNRLDRRRIAEALGTPQAKGTRAVASYDEDTTSLGVEAVSVVGNESNA